MSRRQIFVPLDLLRQHGVTREEIEARRNTAGLRAARYVGDGHDDRRVLTRARGSEERSHAGRGMWLHVFRVADAYRSSSVVGIEGVAGGTNRANEVRLSSSGKGSAQSADMCVDRARLDKDIPRPYRCDQVLA